jgi:ribosomal protein S18 acetylase RimI-like enzyme
MDYELRPSNEADAVFLQELFAEVRGPEFAALQLPAPALAQLLAMQFRAQTMGYAATYPSATDGIVWAAGERAGRLLVHRSDDLLQLIDVALLARYRGLGIGTRLIRELCVEAREKGLPLRLSVRFDNPAARLYQREGFVQTGSDGLNTSMEFRGQPVSDDVEEIGSDAAEEGPVTQGFTSPYFRSLLGQSILAVDLQGRSVALRLSTLHPIPSGGSNRPHTGGQTDSFVLGFTGPLAPVLDSGMVELTPSGAEVMAVFLVPVGPRDQAMQYEAIFNRMTG